ncbi:MAG: aminotransferase class III-fold pyridoxal phosphate-dependent enzyme [Anaerolineae bacterium]|nr:aminotransferase class III-fold pyridoxal phosphate-dependent enzyme [Anaerolineae bacterium]
MTSWTFNEVDRHAAEALQSFLPERVFDAHAHLYRAADLHVDASSLFAQGPQEVGVEVWRAHSARVFGARRLRGGLFLATPTAGCEVERVNDYLLAQLKTDPQSRGSVIVSPAMSPREVEELVLDSQVAGLKPYHVFAEVGPGASTFDAPLSAYLPEWAWELADARGLAITLHMVKRSALADPDNQREIRRMCRRYPKAQLILAHAARGFHAPNTAAGLPALEGLENVWFDAAAICEAAPLTAILRAFGPRRLLWGSDFPVSEIRGRAVTVGDGFTWLEPDTLDWERVAHLGRPMLVVLESLRALREAADAFGLNEEDLQDIFCDNAWRLLGLLPQGGTQTQELYVYAKKRLPGGTQLLSKRPEMLAPDRWPAYFREARGCEIWDLDGRRYVDMSTNCVGACLLGYRDPDVTRAVQRRINLGATCTLNAPEEVELADLLCEIHPWADQVRYARTGGETTTVAVRIARATTDRSLIAICGYHGWHDWYLAANLGDDDSLRGHLLPGLAPLGVPRELRGTALTFHYGDLDGFQRLIDDHGERLAAVIMEPCRYHDPPPSFLERVRDEAHRCGALLIYDEITIGWRLRYGGAHMGLGVYPDIACFAKALGNGHPVGAVIGTREAMQGAHGSFISSTYWTESVGPVAALATLHKMRQVDVPAHVARIGSAVSALWRRQGERHGVPVTIGDGYPCLAHFRFEHPQSEALRTLYTQLMLEQGYLAGTAIYPTMAHSDEVVARYGEAIDLVFAEIAAALAEGDVEARLKGPVAHSGFSRLL